MSWSICRERLSDQNELRILALKQEISEELPRLTQDLTERINRIRPISGGSRNGR